MNIMIDGATDLTVWDEQDIEALARFALESEGAPECTEVSISFVSNDEIATLNGEYRGKEGPTDVLSFPMDDPWDEEVLQDEPDELPIGDIMIAPAVAVAQAGEYGNTPVAEMSLLLVHGILHLLGYDHVVEEEALVMEAREREILAAWNERNDG